MMHVDALHLAGGEAGRDEIRRQDGGAGCRGDGSDEVAARARAESEWIVHGPLPEKRAAGAALYMAGMLLN
jgi:hypothetical protein